MNPIIYILPVVLVIIIFAAGFAAARKKAAAGNAAARTDVAPAAPAAGETRHKERIYEAAGKNQSSDHPLGAVQSVIRGRVRFIPIGLALIGAALMGAYFIFIAKLDVFEAGDAWYIPLAEAALLLAAVGWGLRLFYYATCKIKLRRSGFEMCSILGTKGYEYKDAEFHLFESIEHKNQGDGYRPMIKQAGNYNWVWICQISIKSENRLIEIKSSRYAWLHSKITELTQGLVWVD